jgi:uncharacterized membrane protein YuzA (DUF378 family)
VTTSISAPDAEARRGLRLALLGIAAIPVTAGLIGVAPHGARAAVYLVGLATVSSISIAAGAVARRALSAGRALWARAITAAILGLWVGVTAAVLWFWTLVGIAL